MASSFMIAWEFLVHPGRERRFEEIYGPGGAWAELFRQGEGYIRTELHRDTRNPRRFITLDCWHSEQAYDHFRKQRVADYQALDAQCEELTESEIEIGRFEMI